MDQIEGGTPPFEYPLDATDPLINHAPREVAVEHGLSHTFESEGAKGINGIPTEVLQKLANRQADVG